MDPLVHTSPPRGQAGFSMLELMVSLSLVSIGVLTMAIAQLQALGEGNQARHRTHAAAIARDHVDADLLAMDAKIIDCNSAVFDVANGFAGCLPGCHEVLRRQGLLEGTWCLDPTETLSPAQASEIERVAAEHPELADDDFVRENLERWLAD